MFSLILHMRNECVAAAELTHIVESTACGWRDLKKAWVDERSEGGRGLVLLHGGRLRLNMVKQWKINHNRVKYLFSFSIPVRWSALHLDINLGVCRQGHSDLSLLLMLVYSEHHEELPTQQLVVVSLCVPYSLFPSCIALYIVHLVDKSSITESNLMQRWILYREAMSAFKDRSHLDNVW